MPWATRSATRFPSGCLGNALNAYLVVNPRSADGTTGAQWPRLARMLEDSGLHAETHFTEGPRHATELVREGLRAGQKLIVVVGGDGSINEAVNGFFDAEGLPLAPDAELGILCRGTGCDYIKSLGIPKREDLAIQRILQASSRRVDLGSIRFRDASGQARHRVFCNIAEAGLGGAVVDRVNRSSKRLGGFASFLTSTLATFTSYRNEPMTLQFDDDPPETLVAANLIVGIGSTFGGGMRILPEARLDDGLFDVLLMGDLNRTELFTNIARVYRGTHLSHPKIRHLRARKVTVDAPEPLLLDVDGEQPGLTPATFTIMPGALKVRC
ncbi:Diacylglycerol kinase [compost metagenome]